MGSASSNAPNIDAAIATNSSASGTTTQGLARNVPNALPTSAKIVPSVPNITAMPATYSVASVNARPRDTPLPPNTLMVMGIIG